jgi:hypothetical protein
MSTLLTWDQSVAMLEAGVAETPVKIIINGGSNALFFNQNITFNEIASRKLKINLNIALTFTCVDVSVGNEVPSKLLAVHEIDGARVARHFRVLAVA